MRHKKTTKTLDRKKAARTALYKTQVISLITSKRIKTTKAKAKYFRPSFEKLVTKAKVRDLHSKRYLMKRLNNEKAVEELIDVITPILKDRKGGYTRITAIGRRVGDGAEIVYLELVDRDKMKNNTKKKVDKKVVAPKKTDKKPVKATTSKDTKKIEKIKDSAK
ncbi:MAG: 50S ribosomal protein L17 [bacterium]|nr:50S ribosomal protein L17 [bacterium]